MLDGVGSLWHAKEVWREDLKPGNHIFSWRHGMVYTHHGVYVGADEVIHFTRQQSDEIGINAHLNRAASISPALQPTAATAAGPGGSGSGPCRACGTEGSSHGVISSCLRCFMDGGRLFRFEYGKSLFSFSLQMRGGTCSMAAPAPPHAVVQRARLLLNEGFGRYRLLENNCEDFAVYCKTGLFVLDKSCAGSSGQSAALFYFVSAIAALPIVLSGPLAAAPVFIGLYYSLSRAFLDVGRREDAVKVEGGDLVASLKWNGTGCRERTVGVMGNDGLERVVARMRGGGR